MVRLPAAAQQAAKRRPGLELNGSKPSFTSPAFLKPHFRQLAKNSSHDPGHFPVSTLKELFYILQNALLHSEVCLYSVRSHVGGENNIGKLAKVSIRRNRGIRFILKDV